MVQIVGIVSINGHIRIHTRTPRNTTMHHPSTHSDNDTDQKHHKSLHFLTHLDQSRKCLYLLSRISGCALLNLCWSTKEWVVAALGRRWTWKLWRATCRRASRRFHRQRPWVAKHNEKIFRVDAVAPGRSFHTFYRGNVGRRNNATVPFSGYTMRKRVTTCYVVPLSSHFSRHIPPRSGLPLHGHSSPR